MLIELWHLNDQRTKKKDSLFMCLIEKKNWKQDWKMATYPWTESLHNSRGSISYSTLGVCNMWKTLFGRRNKLWVTPWGTECRIGKGKFWRKGFKGGFKPWRAPWNSTIRQVPLHFFNACILPPILQNSVFNWIFWVKKSLSIYIVVH